MDDATNDQQRLQEYREQFDREWAAVIEPLIDEIDQADARMTEGVPSRPQARSSEKRLAG